MTWKKQAEASWLSLALDLRSHKLAVRLALLTSMAPYSDRIPSRVIHTCLPAVALGSSSPALCARLVTGAGAQWLSHFPVLLVKCRLAE